MSKIDSEHLPQDFVLTQHERSKYETFADHDTSLQGLATAIEELTLKAMVADCCADVSDATLAGLARQITMMVSALVATPCETFPLLTTKHAAIESAFDVISPSPQQVTLARVSLNADFVRLLGESFQPREDD
jgi:hypothetical protein